MYVDDTNLLRWPESSAMNPKELIKWVQWATKDYGCLAQAAGGILKEKKCSAYFLDYKFVRGHAKMKSLHNLPPPRIHVMDEGCIYPLHINIPQPDGPDAPIETHNVTTTSKMLGFHFSPSAIHQCMLNTWSKRRWTGLIASAPNQFPEAMCG
jgi:hypothetical protein